MRLQPIHGTGDVLTVCSRSRSSTEEPHRHAPVRYGKRVGDLSGNVALVTNADRGIGAAVAIALAEAGAEVLVQFHQRQDNKAFEVVAKINASGSRGAPVPADVSDPENAQVLIETVEEHLRIDVLVNVPGQHIPKSLEQMDASVWDATLDKSLRSVFLVTEAALPYMRARQWGRIVNISDIAWQIGGGNPAHAAAMAGILELTRACAALLAPDCITVNAVTPGFIGFKDGGSSRRMSSKPSPKITYADAEEVASAVVTLLSNGNITGQNINILGGMFLLKCACRPVRDRGLLLLVSTPPDMRFRPCFPRALEPMLDIIDRVPIWITLRPVC